MSPDEQTAALVLLDGAQRQIDAARVLLGGQPVTNEAAQLQQPRSRGGTGGGCPSCGDKKAGKVKASIKDDAPDLCGACAYEYPKA